MAANLTDITRGLNLVFGPERRGWSRDLPRAIAMTDVERAPDPVPLLPGLPRGGALILRHTDSSALLEMARRAVPLARRRNHRVLISGEPRVAWLTGADGVHLPEALVRRCCGVAWARLRPGWIITASAHGHRAVRRAENAGADGILLSPVMPTPTHRESVPLGPGRFRALCKSAACPIYGLGGIDEHNMRRLKSTGCRGIAGIGIFLASD